MFLATHTLPSLPQPHHYHTTSTSTTFPYSQYRAAENGFKDACSVLVESGCDMNKMDDYGRSALYLAASNDYVEVVKFLTEQANCLLTCHLYEMNDVGEMAKIEKDSPLHRGCEKGYLTVVQKLIQAGADVNHCICDYSLLFGDSPMHRAAKEGRVDCIKFLVDSGAKMEIQNDDSNTPMHVAAYVGRTDVVQYLVTAGGDFSYKSICLHTITTDSNLIHKIIFFLLLCCHMHVCITHYVVILYHHRCNYRYLERKTL